jgi:hypothetical protein
MALGARRIIVIWMVLREGCVLAGLGRSTSPSHRNDSMRRDVPSAIGTLVASPPGAAIALTSNVPSPWFTSTSTRSASDAATTMSGDPSSFTSATAMSKGPASTP